MSEKPAVTVREPGVTIGGLGITRQVQIAQGDTVAFETAIDATTTIDDLMPVFHLQGEAIKRLKAEAELPKAREALKIAERRPDQLSEELERLKREKESHRVGFMASHDLRNKRSDWKPTEQQKRTLDQFDQQIENVLKSRAACATDIAAAKWMIAKFEAIIAGEEEPPPPDILLDRAVEMSMGRAAAD